MVFIDTSIKTADGTIELDLSKEQSRFKIGSYHLRKEPFTHPSELVELLSTHDMVYNTAPDMPSSGYIYQGRNPNKPRQDDFTSDFTHTYALDFDRLRELNPALPQYNPNWVEKATHIDIANYLSTIFGPVVYLNSKNTVAGRIFLFSSRAVSKIDWYNLIKYYLYHWRGLGMVECAKNNGLHIQHEIMDLAMTRSGKIVTYRNPSTTLNPEGRIKDVTRLCAKLAPKISSQIYPVQRAYTSEAVEHIRKNEEAKAKRSGITVEELNRLQTMNKRPYDMQVVQGGVTMDIQDTVPGAFHELEDSAAAYRKYNNGGIEAIFYFGHGANKQHIVLEYPSSFQPTLHIIKGGYKAATPTLLSYHGFTQSPTGTGKTYEYRFKKNTVIICPTSSLAQGLGKEKEGGFRYVGKGEGLNLTMNGEETISMTYDKFAGHILATEDYFKEYHIVIDEAPRLFKDRSDEYSGSRDRLIQTLCANNQFASVTFISADWGFYEMFTHYGIKGPDVTLNIYKESYDPEITITPYFPKVDGRVGVYCNSIAKAERLSHVYANKVKVGNRVELLPAMIVSKESNYSPSDIDEHPNRNFIFTSIMREGYSLYSHIDHMIVDTMAYRGSPTGVAHTLQAFSRARCRPNLIVVHGMGDSVIPTPDVDTLLSISKPFIGMESKAVENYIEENVDGVLTSPLLRSVASALYRDEGTRAWHVNKAVLIGVYLKSVALLEVSNIEVFKANLRYKTREWDGEVTKKLPKLEKPDGISASSFDKYVKEVDAMEDGNLKERELGKLQRLRESERFSKLTEESKLTIATDSSASIKYYTGEEAYKVFKTVKILGPPYSIKSWKTYANHLIKAKIFKELGRKSHTLRDLHSLMDRAGINWEYIGKSGVPLIKVKKKARGSPLSHYTDGETIYKVGIEKSSDLKYPIGALIKTEDIDKFFLELYVEDDSLEREQEIREAL